MISELSGTTENLVRAVLDASLLRYKIISNNIANNDVRGFKPSNVNFEDILNAELNSKEAINNNQRIESALTSVRPEIVERESSVIDGKPENTLDLEMSDLAKNTLRYEALIKSLENLGSIKTMAITGRAGK